MIKMFYYYFLFLLTIITTFIITNLLLSLMIKISNATRTFCKKFL